MSVLGILHSTHNIAPKLMGWPPHPWEGISLAARACHIVRYFARCHLGGKACFGLPLSYQEGKMKLSSTTGRQWEKALCNVK